MRIGKCSEIWLMLLNISNPHTGGSPQAPSETPRKYNPSHPNRDINQNSNLGVHGLDYLFCSWLVGFAYLICLVPVIIFDLLTAGIFVICTATWVNVYGQSLEIKCSKSVPNV